MIAVLFRYADTKEPFANPAISCQVLYRRVSGLAVAWRARGPEFESRQPDQYFKSDAGDCHNSRRSSLSTSATSALHPLAHRIFSDTAWPLKKILVDVPPGPGITYPSASVPSAGTPSAVMVRRHTTGFARLFTGETTWHLPATVLTTLGLAKG
jgi:hypothetical protein